MIGFVCCCMVDPKIYYTRPIVQKEIAEYSRNRWIALHCQRTDKDGRQILIRYSKNKPLTISNPHDVYRIIKRFNALNPRTFYASANIYIDLSSKEKVMDYLNNVIKRTPTWDIDSKIDLWKYTIECAHIIIDYLEKENITKSVYLVWSGNGCHVRIHEDAFSEEIYENTRALDLGYAVVEYVLMNIKEKLKKLQSKVPNHVIKVENLMDPQRVFTAPLSLHRTLDVSCIAFKPDQLDDFDISWVNPQNPRHFTTWRQFKKGEGDELAIKAYKEIGPYMQIQPEENTRQIKLEKEKPVSIKGDVLYKLDLDNLRFNPIPPPIKDGREFSKGPLEAFRKIEDILSLFAAEKITLEHAIRALNYARFAIIPYQSYPKEVIRKLDQLYHETILLLEKLRTPEKVRQWLLQKGAPRKIVKKLDEFFKNEN